MNVVRWTDRKVFWFIEFTANKTPGWIISRIKGGPATPTEGVTMRLFSEKRLDKQAPKQLLGKDNMMSVAFSLEKYGQHWFLLLETDAQESSESDLSASRSDSSDSESSGVEDADAGSGAESSSEI